MSDIRAGTIGDTAGTGPITLTGQSAPKAWCNFDGTATTGTASMTSVRGSLNISSVVDISTGSNLLNYTNSFANVNYSASSGTNVANNSFGGNYYLANQFLVATQDSDGTSVDAGIVAFIAVGDLA